MNGTVVPVAGLKKHSMSRPNVRTAPAGTKLAGRQKCPNVWGISDFSIFMQHVHNQRQPHAQG